MSNAIWEEGSGFFKHILYVLIISVTQYQSYSIGKGYMPALNTPVQQCRKGWIERTRLMTLP